MRQARAASLPVAAGLALVPACTFASEDNQLWVGGSAIVRVDDSVRLSQEIVARFSDTGGGLYEIEANTMIGVRVGVGMGGPVTAWAGYVHDPLYVAGRFRVMEHRLRQQVDFDDIVKIGRGRVQLRLRMEQRWREGSSAGIAWRLRPIVRFVLPLDASGRTRLQVQHESFVSLNANAFQSFRGEDRMRNAVSVRRALGQSLAIEAGYLNQHRFVPRQPDQVDHALTLTLGLSL